MAIADLQAEVVAAEKRRRLYTSILVMLTVVIVVAGFAQSNSMNSGGFVQGIQKFFEYPAEIFAEAWEKRGDAGALIIKFIPALIETINIALVATILGGVIAMALAFAATRGLGMPGWLVVITRRTMDTARAFPELVIALFLIYVLGGSPIPAMIAVAFHTAGALGKLFSEVNENIDMKPLEGLQAVGANWTQRMRYAVMPQIAANYVSYFLLRFEINVRASAILGFVGAGGIGTELRRTIGWGKGAHDETAAIFLLLFLTIFAVDQFSSWLRSRLVAQSGH